jgi:hypothetical protein
MVGNHRELVQRLHWRLGLARCSRIARVIFHQIGIISTRRKIGHISYIRLDTIEVMCNEILGNYTKKEDQLMTAAFGTRPKRRLNRVMDALNFEYPDYERLNKGAEGQKRKRIVSVLGREAARMVKENEEILKKRKFSPEPKVVAPKKRKVAAPKQKATDIEEETPSTPSAADV